MTYRTFEVTVGGEEITVYGDENDYFTIPGEKVTGDIVIRLDGGL